MEINDTNKRNYLPLNMKKTHSKPVPRFYKSAAGLLKQCCDRKVSLQTVMYESNVKSCEFKRVYAVLSKVLNNYSCIEFALNAVKLFEEQPQFNKQLAFILASEMHMKKADLMGDCKPISVINGYGAKLREIITERIKGKEESQPAKVPFPKYVRINTLLKSEEEVHSKLEGLDYELLEYDRGTTSYDEFLTCVQNLGQSEYTKDYHIPDLLVFSPKQDFWKTDLYKKSYIILQDKASCLPAFLCGVKPGDAVIDACAAPGNKTSHLAQLMANTGRLVAIDKNRNRFLTLQTLLHNRGVSCVETLNSDFKFVDPTDYEETTAILVDPSCSSSGTSAHEDKLSQERVLHLAEFQIQVLSRALSFPNVKTVVYSTCSIFEQENEEVVEAALSKYGSSFHLEDLSLLLPGWKHFGSSKYEFGSMCVRTLPSVDQCNGFFVAKFVRNDDSQQDTCKKKKRKKNKAASERKHAVKRKKQI